MLSITIHQLDLKSPTHITSIQVGKHRKQLNSISALTSITFDETAASWKVSHDHQVLEITLNNDMQAQIQILAEELPVKKWYNIATNS